MNIFIPRPYTIIYTLHIQLYMNSFKWDGSSLKTKKLPKALESFGHYSECTYEWNVFWWIIITACNHLPRRYLALFRVIHMELPETQPNCVNAVTMLVISGFDSKCSDLLPLHSASQMIRMQVISIKCTTFQYIVVQNINFIIHTTGNRTRSHSCYQLTHDTVTFMLLSGHCRPNTFKMQHQVFYI